MQILEIMFLSLGFFQPSEFQVILCTIFIVYPLKLFPFCFHNFTIVFSVCFFVFWGFFYFLLLSFPLSGIKTKKWKTQ